jgi:hypothetical protein
VMTCAALATGPSPYLSPRAGRGGFDVVRVLLD